MEQKRTAAVAAESSKAETGILSSLKDITDSASLKDGDTSAQSSRERTIVRTSVLGIAMNVFLAAFKATAGFFSHSIAITLDAVNNLTDAGSSLITIVGTKLAAKDPDRKHPFGYGRFEYLSAMIVAVIVLYAGITSLFESAKRIASPEAPEYSTVTLVIISVAVVVKIAMGLYTKKIGRKVNSDSLVNSGEDASFDAVISASTLVAAVVFLLFGLSVEAWLGTAISIQIIRSGIDMIRESISKILGEHDDTSLLRKIHETVVSFPDVQDAYDLVLNNYGPDNWNGSIHIAVNDTLTADKLDELTRQITLKVLSETGVILTAIGVYSVNTQDPEVIAARKKAESIALGHKYVKQIHGFYLSKENRTVRMDTVVSFDAPDRRLVQREVAEEIAAAFPGYRPQIALDIDLMLE